MVNDYSQSIQSIQLFMNHILISHRQHWLTVFHLTEGLEMSCCDFTIVTKHGMSTKMHTVCVFLVLPIYLTHWDRVTHTCLGKLTSIGSDNGLSPGRRQAIIWTSAGILSIGPLGTNFSEILIGIQTFSFKKMHLKMSSVKWRPFCLGLNVLRLTSQAPACIWIISLHECTKTDNIYNHSEQNFCPFNSLRPGNA